MSTDSPQPPRDSSSDEKSARRRRKRRRLAGRKNSSTATSAADATSGAHIRFDTPAGAATTESRPRRFQTLNTPTNWLLATAFLLAAAGVWQIYQGTLLTLASPGEKKVRELESLQIKLTAIAHDNIPRDFRYQLVNPPVGAQIDELSGEFSWVPTEEQGPGRYTIEVRVNSASKPSLAAGTRFNIAVEEVNQPPELEPIADHVVHLESASSLQIPLVARDLDRPAQRLRFVLLEGPEYGLTLDATQGILAVDAQAVRPGEIVRGAVAVGDSMGEMSSIRPFRIFCAAGSPPRPEQARLSDDRRPNLLSADDANRLRIDGAVVPAAANLPSPKSGPEAHGIPAGIVALYREGELFSPQEYATVRGLFAEKFERDQAAILARIVDEDPRLRLWLDEHAGIKEELYTAIDPRHDDVRAALALFGELQRRFPAELARWSEAAIAVSVVWDDPQMPYDFLAHARGVGAVVAEELSGPLDQFEYLLQSEAAVSGRTWLLPREFLIHVVNDRTPKVERDWARQNYWPQRVLFGQCYGRVPRTAAKSTDEERTPADWIGTTYSLENVLRLGGAPAQQADFAARVGKALGIPAEFVADVDDPRRAWVMWVELKNVTPESIAYSLESYGRSGDEEGYVGTLHDPQTGEPVSDRLLASRLTAVGQNVRAKRQADLLMRAFRGLRDGLKLTSDDQAQYLLDVLRLCGGYEPAWRELASISRSGNLSLKRREAITESIDQLLVAFARQPDLASEVLGDLAACEDNVDRRAALHQRLLSTCDLCGRPDLACRVASELADVLAASGRETDACRALIGTILRYPNEGRYVSRLVEQFDALAEDVPRGAEMTVLFYRQLLPKIERERAGGLSPYCVAMYERAIAGYRRAGDAAATDAAEAELRSIKAASPNEKRD